MQYRVPHRVAYVSARQQDEALDGPLFLRRVPGGPTVVLRDTAAVIWRLAVDGVEDVTADLADLINEPAAQIDDTVADFLRALVRQGLLEERR